MSWIARLTRRFQRRALTHRNLVYWLWRYAANGTRTFRLLTSRPSHADTSELTRELKSRGIVMGPSDRFLTEDGLRTLETVSGSILETSESDAVQAIVSGSAAPSNKKKDFLVHLVDFPRGVPAGDPLLKLALDTRLLEIVSLYLGMWPRLHSVAAWLNYPTPIPASTSQLWHSDPEDLTIIKVFIYLTDVGEQSGPFTYVPETQPFGRKAKQAARCKKRGSDDDMRRVFPSNAWQVCTGAKHTMILADTLGCHRGGKPESDPRILITFTYTSATPLVHRQIRITGTPDWITADIQRAAFGDGFA